MLWASQACASVAQVHVEWDPVPGQVVSGYRVYWHPQNSVAEQMVDVGDTLSAPLSGLVQGTTYEVAVSSYADDGSESSLSDAIEFTYQPLVDTEPVADAGSDRTVSEGVAVTLDGSASLDPEGQTLTYAWQQISGPSVTLYGATGAQPTFNAPQVDAAGATLIFRLTVSDPGGNSASATCTVTVSNVAQAPVADAGSDLVVKAGKLVILDGSGSQDGDSDIVSWQWTQTSGPEVGLSQTMQPQVGFTAPTTFSYTTTLSFTLLVRDASGATDYDYVNVKVIKYGTSDDSDYDGLSDELELELGTNPYQADSDGDGLTDGLEYLLWGQDAYADLDHDGVPNILDPDADGDGMTDGWEYAYGLDPTVNDAYSDADGDGRSNYREFVDQTDPQDETSKMLPSVASIAQVNSMLLLGN